MEIEKYLLPLRRWWWLLVVATSLAALSSFLATVRQPPIYQARSTLIVGQALYDPNPTTNEFVLSQELATNYADIANREPMRFATMQALGLTSLPSYIAQAVPNGQFLEILVNDTIPERAQAVANEVANQLILVGPTSVQGDDVDRTGFVNDQLNSLEIQIAETEAKIKELQEDLGNLVSASQISDTQTQLGALQNKLTTMQTIYADLLSTTQSGATNTLSIIERASVPRRPVGPNKGLTVALAAMVGFGLATVAAYLLDYLDTTVKSSKDIEKLTNSAIIGYLSELDIEQAGKLYVAENPRNPIVEEYRSLRNNLEFAGVDQPLKAIFVSSADSGDGKSSVAANLAVIMAQAEKKVILLDADMRRPNVHNFFGMPNDYGLSDIFRGRLNLEGAAKEWNNGMVSVITAGSVPPNPAELLGSKKMSEILQYLKDHSDVLIVDGPPFIVADAAVLASKVDGILAVVRIGHTQEPAVRNMMEQIKRAGARVIGVALNRIPAKSFRYYTGNRYYTSYMTAEDNAARKKRRRAGFRSRIPVVNRFFGNGSRSEFDADDLIPEVDLPGREGD
jgi:capsular exopolysaccharide synthesis family protein